MKTKIETTETKLFIATTAHKHGGRRQQQKSIAWASLIDLADGLIQIGSLRRQHSSIYSGCQFILWRPISISISISPTHRTFLIPFLFPPTHTLTPSQQDLEDGIDNEKHWKSLSIASAVISVICLLIIVAIILLTPCRCLYHFS